MTKPSVAGTALALLLLAGCEGEPASRNTAGPPVMKVANAYHDQMLALNPLQRDAALRRAIRSAGESCDRVEAAAFQQEHANLKMWTARCQTKSYAVFLAANGDVQVRSCADAATLRLPACRALPALPEAG